MEVEEGLRSPGSPPLDCGVPPLPLQHAQKFIYLGVAIKGKGAPVESRQTTFQPDNKIMRYFYRANIFCSQLVHGPRRGNRKEITTIDKKRQIVPSVLILMGRDQFFIGSLLYFYAWFLLHPMCVVTFWLNVGSNCDDCNKIRVCEMNI
jgi:hypothetical protein